MSTTMPLSLDELLSVDLDTLPPMPEQLRILVVADAD